MVDSPLIRYDGPVPTSVMLPDLAALGELSPDDLVAALAQYGQIRPPDYYAARYQDYVARMTNKQGAEFDAEVKRLMESSTALLGQARETRRDWVNGVQADGDDKAEFIWLTCMDEKVCGPCEERGGDIRTYAEWEATGLPGAGVCDGGDLDRCELIRLEDQ